MTPHRTCHHGPVWRIFPAARAGNPTGPARHPEGRFHHDGQPALYASLSPEGAGVAVARYVAAGAPLRAILRLHVTATRLADLCCMGVAPSIVWQDHRAAGRDAPTWALSDAARAAGVQGLLHRSRTRPDLKHLVLFDLSAATFGGVGEPPRPWP